MRKPIKTRLEQTERTLRRNPTLQKEYLQAIQANENEGTSEECLLKEIPPVDGSSIHYVPHYAAVKLERETTRHLYLMRPLRLGTVVH